MACPSEGWHGEAAGRPCALRIRDPFSGGGSGKKVRAVIVCSWGSVVPVVGGQLSGLLLLSCTACTGITPLGPLAPSKYEGRRCHVRIMAAGA